jgi:hypothetical protein
MRLLLLPGLALHWCIAPAVDLLTHRAEAALTLLLLLLLLLLVVS